MALEAPSATQYVTASVTEEQRRGQRDTRPELRRIVRSTLGERVARLLSGTKNAKSTTEPLAEIGHRVTVCERPAKMQCPRRRDIIDSKGHDSATMTNPASRHVFADHVGEVRLRVESSTLAGIFEEAARALAELMMERSSGPADSEEAVAIHAKDREALLVDWLNELIFLSETRHRIYGDVRVHRVSNTDLEATVRGAFPETLRTAVKAATLHGLEIEESTQGFSASLVLDV